MFIVSLNLVLEKAQVKVRIGSMSLIWIMKSLLLRSGKHMLALRYTRTACYTHIHSLTHKTILIFLALGVIRRELHNHESRCTHEHTRGPFKLPRLRGHWYRVLPEWLHCCTSRRTHANDCHARFVQHEVMGRKHNCRECVIEMNIRREINMKRDHRVGLYAVLNLIQPLYSDIHMLM